MPGNLFTAVTVRRRVAAHGCEPRCALRSPGLRDRLLWRVRSRAVCTRGRAARRARIEDALVHNARAEDSEVQGLCIFPTDGRWPLARPVYLPHPLRRRRLGGAILTRGERRAQKEGRRPEQSSDESE